MGDPVSVLDDTVICIPSKRPPPVKSLLAFPTVHPVLLIADPRVYTDHQAWARSFPNIQVVRGKVGMAPQSAECYRHAYFHGYRYYFRMDDDLHARTFVHADKAQHPTLAEAMIQARACAFEMSVTLAGFINSSVRIWFKTGGYARSYGLIHGGAHLCIAAEDPGSFIDESLPAYEDVYRSAAHRERDGAVGRVRFIGLDKRASLRDSSMSKTPEAIAKAREIILARFPNTVKCVGTRTLDGGRQVIPNWRLVRGKHFVAKPPRRAMV